MSEKRKPYLVVLLKKRGNKTRKLEIFEATLFDENKTLARGAKLFRLRTNGKWFSGKREQKTFFKKWEIRDLLMRSLP